MIGQVIRWYEPLKMMAINGPDRQFITVFDNLNFVVFGRAAGGEQLLKSPMVTERKGQQQEDIPSLLAIDSQLVETTQFIDEEAGIDANKKINGRERSIAVDRPGLSWSIAVSAANVSDNEAGRLVVD